jgi:hypothetical protein
LGTIDRVVVVDIMALRKNGPVGDAMRYLTLAGDVIPGSILGLLADPNIMKVGDGLTDTMGHQLAYLGMRPIENTVDTQKLMHEASDEYFKLNEKFRDYSMRELTAWVYGLDSPKDSHRPLEGQEAQRAKSLGFVAPCKTKWLYQWQTPLTADHLGFLFTEGRTPVLACLDLMAEVIRNTRTKLKGRSLSELIMTEIRHIVSRERMNHQTQRMDIFDILDAYRFVPMHVKSRGRLWAFTIAAWQVNEAKLITRFPRITFLHPDGKRVGPSGLKPEAKDPPKAPALPASREEIQAAQEAQSQLDKRQSQPSSWNVGAPASLGVAPRPEDTPASKADVGRIEAKILELASQVTLPPSGSRSRRSPEPRHQGRGTRESPSHVMSHLSLSGKTTEVDSSSDHEGRPSRRYRGYSSSSEEERYQARRGSGRSPVKRG